jgi:hypothetical protein
MAKAAFVAGEFAHAFALSRLIDEVIGTALTADSATSKIIRSDQWRFKNTAKPERS